MEELENIYCESKESERLPRGVGEDCLWRRVPGASEVLVVFFPCPE